VTAVVVAAALAAKPGNAGAAWTRVSWVAGLRELGFDAHLVEQLPGPAEPGALAWFRSVATAAGLDGAATLLDSGGRPLHGHSRTDLEEVAAGAAMVVNVSGNLRDRRLLSLAGRRVYVDLDPGWTQLWHHQGVLPLGGHDHWFTVGALVGTPACAVPTGDLPWRPVRQPVSLAAWPAVPRPAAAGADRFTTVAAWRGPYGVAEQGGRTVGGKVHEFRRFLSLPRLAPGAFEVALDIHPADAKDRAALEEAGWRVRDPGEVAGDLASFRHYVQGSTAEASVAQGMYVHATTGWFGDRSVRYLASGRPVLLQDTGFTRTLPCGDGIVPFSTLGESVAGAESILGDYDRHAAAARRLAEDLFSAPAALGPLCEEVGVAP
jgi:hypothetical protein